MWRLYARYRRSFPVPVSLMRFRSARLDFIFGIASSFRCEDHRHVAALELWFLFDFPDVLQLLRDAVQHFPAQLDVRHLPAAVHHRHLHFVAVFQEFTRVPGLEVEIVIVDPGAVFHFLQVNHVLLFLGGARRLRLLELELPIVHDLDDGGPGERRDFHEIQAPFGRGGDRFIDRQHPQLVAVVRDHAHRTDADLPIHTCARCFAVVVERWQLCDLLYGRKKADPDSPKIRNSSPTGEVSRTLEHSQREACGWGTQPTYHIVATKLAEHLLFDKSKPLALVS